MHNQNNWYVKGCKAVARILRARFKKIRSHINSQSRYYKLKEALKFANMQLEPADVLLFSCFISLILCLSSVTIFAALYFLNPLSQNILLFLLPFVMVILLAIAVYLANYPKYYAEQLKLKSFGKLPEAINYLGVGMQISPQLEKAVKLAADNTEEPLGSALKKMLWNVYVRKHANIEDSMVNFANEHDCGDEFKQALYIIRSAELESSESGRERCIEKASELVITSTKSKIDSFANSLTAPTMVLFSIGVLLPMILSAMLPLLTIGGLKLTVLEISVLLLFVFPCFTACYARHILSKRPGTLELSTIPNSLTKIRILVITIVALAIACAIFFSGYILSLVFHIQNIMLLFIIVGIGTSLGAWLIAKVKAQKEERDKLRKLEEELPDVLFVLGNRIAENQPLEKVLKDTSQLLGNKCSSDLLTKICYRINLERAALDKVLFGKCGILENHPSRIVKTAFRALVKTTEKDNLSAGRSLVRISNYLRALKKVENDIRSKLGSAINMMLATALYFAPLILGITSALYQNLLNALVNVSGAENLNMGALGLTNTVISSDIFTLIVGLYLIILVVIIVYFCSGILYDTDSIERDYQTGKILPKATFIFACSAILGQWIIAI
ncbi:MAG: hypothetical protein QME47_04265 [Candidatus Thermoplasmatota archaeon]|nr:hypothetical protein [Candidatus Thermoplasmatota archaeon]